MKSNRFVLAFSLLILLALVALGASAHEKHEHEHRQHGAHVHGIAALNLVLEGDELYVELDSPAANMIGFEHAPSSEADHAAFENAVATLKNGDRLFRFDTAAGCRMEKADVMSSMLDEQHAEPMGDHGHEKGQGHDKEEHGHGIHSDIEAIYYFECQRPGQLTQLTVELFDAFAGMEKLNVQYVIESKQGAAELTSANHAIKF